ncbi:PucR family transcriptional regulator [Streptomyces sp. NPDC090073]|uniref:PucR family transcriptional regulator n=1 Tax=Streptomyces sp. NPDC090073 TaxID=3365936 RepID=UPI0038061311
MQQDSSRPLPVPLPALAGHLRPHLTAVAEDTVDAIRRSVPDYGRLAHPAATRSLRLGVDIALSGFVDRITAGCSPGKAAESRRMFERVGATEADEGRSLTAVHAALRLGARAAWRSMLDRVDRSGVTQETLAAVVEVMLLHMEDIADAVTAGHLARSGGRQSAATHAPRLADRLVADPPPSLEEVRALARTHQWKVPRRFAVAVFASAAGDRQLLLPPGMLVGGSAVRHVIVPEPAAPGRMAALRRSLQGARAAISPPSSVTEGHRALRWATDALHLARRGIIPDDGLVQCTDHLATLLLFRDEKLLDVLSRRHLGPLSQVRRQHQDKLAETLLAWLHGANANSVADRLEVHPQTVRYRMRQLEELYGSKLRHPDAKFELEMALRAKLLKAGADTSLTPERRRGGNDPRGMQSPHP